MKIKWENNLQTPWGVATRPIPCGSLEKDTRSRKRGATDVRSMKSRKIDLYRSDFS